MQVQGQLGHLARPYLKIKIKDGCSLVPCLAGIQETSTEKKKKKNPANKQIRNERGLELKAKRRVWRMGLASEWREKGTGVMIWSGNGVGAALGALRISRDSSWAWDTVNVGRGVFLSGM